MKIGKFLNKNTEVAAFRLSENFIYIKFLEKKAPDRIIVTNNLIGEKIGFDDERWNFEFEGKKHFVIFSFLADELKVASKNYIVNKNKA